MALGVFRVPLNKRQFFTVTGGPFYDCPVTMVGVKMAKEIKRTCAVDIPTVDFETPDPEILNRGLSKAVDFVLAGKPIYVGCMGGKGRTGLFLAVLAKAFDVPNPVESVRAKYYAHAVETREQYKFVQEFVVNPAIKDRIARTRRWSWLKFWKTNLTDLPPVEKGERLTAIRRVQ